MDYDLTVVDFGAKIAPSSARSLEGVVNLANKFLTYELDPGKSS